MASQFAILNSVKRNVPVPRIFPTNLVESRDTGYKPVEFTANRLTTPYNVLPQSPLAPIGEHSQFTRFAPPSSSTPYEPLVREPPPRYPTSSPARGIPSTFMEPLSRMVHSQLETPRTLS